MTCVTARPRTPAIHRDARPAAESLVGLCFRGLELSLPKVGVRPRRTDPGYRKRRRQSRRAISALAGGNCAQVKDAAPGRDSTVRQVS